MLAFNPKFESITIKDQRSGGDHSTRVFKLAEKKVLSNVIDLHKDIILIKIENGSRDEIDHLVMGVENHNLQIVIRVND